MIRYNQIVLLFDKVLKWIDADRRIFQIFELAAILKKQLWNM